MVFVDKKQYPSVKWQAGSSFILFKKSHGTNLLWQIALELKDNEWCQSYMCPFPGPPNRSQCQQINKSLLSQNISPRTKNRCGRYAKWQIEWDALALQTYDLILNTCLVDDDGPRDKVVRENGIIYWVESRKGRNCVLNNNQIRLLANTVFSILVSDCLTVLVYCSLVYSSHLTSIVSHHKD